MSQDRPTLAELRARAQKGRSGEIGSWLARAFARPTAIHGTWLAVRLGLSAHQVTLGALSAALASAVLFGMGSPLGFLAGTALAFLAYWLDHVDGQVARWRGTASLDGVYFDYLMHHVAQPALAFGLGYGASARGGRLEWTIAGFAAALGWSILSLANDCRYKAFFQRLKSSSLSYRVEGGSGGAPAPAAPWPRRGLGAVSWPLYKLCEPPVILLELATLAAIAVILPGSWALAVNLWLLAHAIVAPALCTLRAGRAIARGSVETEFALWFRDSASATPSFTPAHRPGMNEGAEAVRARSLATRPSVTAYRGPHHAARSHSTRRP